MSTIGFNPQIHTRPSPATDAAAPKPSTSPSFMRGTDASKPAWNSHGLEALTQFNGKIFNTKACAGAFLSDMGRLLKELHRGDLPAARERFARMEKFDLKEMFEAYGIDPEIMRDIKVALHASNDSHRVFGGIARILDFNGITRQNHQLRMPHQMP